MKYLDLSENNLEVLDKDLFASNHQLEFVHLHGNNLKQIFIDFTELLKAEWITLGADLCIGNYYLKGKDEVHIKERESF